MEIVEHVFRIVIPFEDIYTTVFLIQTAEGVLMFDTATFGSDMDQYVFPVLEEINAVTKYVFISHSHRDHAGGLSRVCEKFPGIQIVARSEMIREKYPNVLSPADDDRLLGVLQVVEIPGHTRDCMGLLDLRSKTLLTGDSLQIYGIYGSGNWGANIRFPREHLAALDKIRKLDVQTMIASHDYHPCGFIARGKREVERYIAGCSDALYEIAAMLRDNPDLDDAAAAKRYNQTKGFPTVGFHVFEAVRRELM